MIPSEEKQLASILVNYSIKIKKGDLIEVSSGTQAKDFVLEICKEILKKGAMPVLRIGIPGFAYTYYKYASEEMLKMRPKMAIYEAKMFAGSIIISSDYNTKELTSVDPKKISLRRKLTREVSKISLQKNNWVLCGYPSHALAQDAEMSLPEFRDFVFGATNQDWEKMSKQQTKLKRKIDHASTVRIVGKDTDITFSIKGRQGIKCDGHRNMPDGEVFVAPVETSTQGKICYDYPAIYSGKEVDGVCLEFKNGKVVKYSATKNQALLGAMLNTDKGAKYLGEFGIGVNYGIDRFIKQILFDEKIGGTIHLALGMAYKEGGGKNESALHWDMIKDLRKGGAIYLDGKCIQKNGKFQFSL